MVSAQSVPNPSILAAGEALSTHPDIMANFNDYPGDTTNRLNGCVLAREGFQPEQPYHLRICKDCLRDLKRKTMPNAALANGLWIGDLPEDLADSTWVELAAASPVRTSGMVFALEQLKVGSIPRSAQRMMRGTFTFFFQNAYSVEAALPSCDVDIAGSMTCALVGARPSTAQLRKIFGARRQKIKDLMDFQRDSSRRLAGKHHLFHRATMSQANLETFPQDGSVPHAIWKSLIATSDPDKTRQKARSTYVPDNRETEVPVTSDEGNDADDTDAAFVIDNVGVIPSGEDVSQEGRPDRLRALGASLVPPNISLAERAAATDAAAAGRPPPQPTKNMLVIPHTGKMVEDFHEPGTMIAAYFHLFPHAVGGPLDKRVRALTFTRWAKIILRRRDSRFRKSRTFIFCLAAIIFRREAISNAHWKLNGRISRGVASTLAGITPEDLRDAAREMEEGSSAAKALANRPAARKLILTMQSVNSGASWTIFNKRALRMKAISLIMQLGQPLFWMTINPNDKTSPIVMKLGGVDLDISSRLKTDLPTYVERIQKIAEDPVASADFFHITIDAVMKCLLRFGAKDGDGGVLGRVKAYVGMTEEQKRLTLHCHLLVWCYGYQDFSSLRDTMDKTPDSYQELASFLSRTIFCQVASEEDVQHAFRGDEEPTGTERDHVPPAEDPLERPATECIPVPPPSACYPPPRIERNVVAENEYFRHFQPDVANVTRKANTHACTFTCHKFGHANSCRYVSIMYFAPNMLPIHLHLIHGERLFVLHADTATPFLHLSHMPPIASHQVWFRQWWKTP